MTISKSFRALALGTAIGASAMVGMASDANAMEPVTSCDSSKIFAHFQTAQGGQAFGRDGCVYGTPGGQPLALRNYDLHNSNEATRFNNEFANAERYATIHAQQQQRMQEQRQRMCGNSIQGALGGLLHGGRPNLNGLLNAGRNCM